VRDRDAGWNTLYLLRALIASAVKGMGDFEILSPLAGEIKACPEPCPEPCPELVEGLSKDEGD